MKTENHNLPLPMQDFSDPYIDMLVKRARLDEAMFIEGFFGFWNPTANQRICQLIEQSRVATDKYESLSNIL